VATFPLIKPTYGQQKRSAPNTRTVRFADGYEHRILFGLAQNQNPKVFNFTYNVSETEANTIETFLDDRANDTTSFDFPTDYLPGEIASNFRFVCEQWTKSIPYKNRATIQATFRQVFEP
jgi:phage-related protein